MRKILNVLLAAAVVWLATGCTKKDDTAMSNIDKNCVEKTVKALSDKYASVEGIEDCLARGVEQAAAFWTEGRSRLNAGR